MSDAFLRSAPVSTGILRSLPVLCLFWRIAPVSTRVLPEEPASLTRPQRGSTPWGRSLVKEKAPHCCRA